MKHDVWNCVHRQARGPLGMMACVCLLRVNGDDLADETECWKFHFTGDFTVIRGSQTTFIVAESTWLPTDTGWAEI